LSIASISIPSIAIEDDPEDEDDEEDEGSGRADFEA
jgi:hypothetical protein